MSKTIGQKVKEARNSVGVTQKELSLRMGIVGTNSITLLERDQYRPTVHYLHRIADALHIGIERLLPEEWLSAELVRNMSMTLNDYQALAARTINKKLEPVQVAFHALHGMVGEIGEIHSLYQKTYQGHEMLAGHVKKELGDLLWFISEYCTAMGWELEDVAQMNIDKLMARYPDGFDADKSLHRKEGDI